MFGFCVGPLPRSFVASLLFPLAKRKSGWGICGSSGVLVPVCPCLFLFLCHSIFCTAGTTVFQARFFNSFYLLILFTGPSLRATSAKPEGKKASARGLPKTTATSISHPSFLMYGERPICSWRRMANARFCFSPSLHWLAMQGMRSAVAHC